VKYSELVIDIILKNLYQQRFVLCKEDESYFDYKKYCFCNITAGNNVWVNFLAGQI